MKRVVITGLGIVSSIGNNVNEVLKSLQLEKSGISFNKEQADLGFRSHVCGDVSADIKKLVPRKDLRFMGDGAAYSHISMAEAINDSNLSQDEISNNRTGLIVGSGASSGLPIVEMSDVLRSKGARRVNPFFVPKIMSSCNSANLATAFKIKGFNYSISSACATSSHCLGNAFHTIQNGLQDRMFVGGGDEITYIITLPFDAMGALSANFNDLPEKASRPYDKDRDGFVVSGGGGTIILEEYEIAKNRGAKIYCEVTGYGLSSDGFDMVRPSGEGAEFCMKMATKDLKEPIDYLNAHGTSTPAGDITELKAIKNAFSDKGYMPLISSTKSLTGHSLGAAGVHESIYSILMLKNSFIPASVNIDNLDPEAEGFPIVQEGIQNQVLNNVMSNSFGFGGTNCSLVFSRI
ncbi:MAG: beta-ketoacyl-[acyl-carrier-protein] synthase I [Candidatus Marinimicrobia bacterium]|nr:beta-ketoacyl-[acyl-carrier-protein] synthase I [Candidatus Neomarinimicrobiota bacterium]OUW50882.1 MAG: beta-ketoacyl-[acyl-carrier-protein] synthase I [bacterium TMED190]|tara:strand:- start:31517 stop:32734 length:1218 start_codon:yes stop_codon:yes gene_type:complete